MVADPLYAFDADTAVTAVGPGRYAAEVTRRWDIGVVPNGGYVLAIALAGIRASLAHPHPLTVSAHYLGPSAAGSIDVEVDVLKQGRSLSNASARLVQGGRVTLAVLAIYGDLGAQVGPTLVDVAPPELPPPDECPRRDSGLRNPFPVPPAITEVVDFRPAPESAAWLRGDGGGPASLSGWIRFHDGRPVDVHALPMLCDAMPPAVFSAMRTGWVPTLELTVHVRAVPCPGWLRARATTRVLVDGLCEEDCELWDADGHLVAMSRQLARVLPASA